MEVNWVTGQHVYDAVLTWVHIVLFNNSAIKELELTRALVISGCYRLITMIWLWGRLFDTVCCAGQSIKCPLYPALDRVRSPSAKKSGRRYSPKATALIRTKQLLSPCLRILTGDCAMPRPCSAASRQIDTRSCRSRRPVASSRRSRFDREPNRPIILNYTK